MTFPILGHRRLATGVFLSYDRRYLIDESRAVARDVVRHPGGIAILPIEKDEVWLVSQFRTAAGRRVLEVPAGRLDPLDRNPLQAAQRELAEEIGAVASTWQHLTSMLPSPGYTDESIHIYAACDLSFSKRKPEGAEERSLEIMRCSLAEALDGIDRGEIVDAKTQVALLLWAKHNLWA